MVLDTKKANGISALEYEMPQLYRKVICLLYTMSFVINSIMGTMAALNQALADRNKPKDVIHHSDCGVQYLSICYTNKMAESKAIASVGITDDSFDNALAKTVSQRAI